MMKYFYLTIFFSLLFLTSQPIQAATPVAQIQAILEQPEVICGRFEQTKFLVNIKKPLVSNGRFCVVANQGVLWQTLKPFANTLRLTRNEIIQTHGERVAMHLDAKQEPVVKMINSVLFSLLAGDLTQLQKLFQLDSNLQNNQWHVALKAREPALAKTIGRISLEGSQYVRKVTMQEENGDRTLIMFSAIKSGNKAITTEERALLENKP